MLHKICNHGNTFVYTGLRKEKCSGWGINKAGPRLSPKGGNILASLKYYLVPIYLLQHF